MEDKYTCEQIAMKKICNHLPLTIESLLVCLEDITAWRTRVLTFSSDMH